MSEWWEGEGIAKKFLLVWNHLGNQRRKVLWTVTVRMKNASVIWIWCCILPVSGGGTKEFFVEKKKLVAALKSLFLYMNTFKIFTLLSHILGTTEMKSLRFYWWSLRRKTMYYREPQAILIFLSVNFNKYTGPRQSLVLQILGLSLIGSPSQKKGGTTYPGHLSFKSA